jgi:hypothetical protein
MPYKDPERKRQWELEHREQRNARRRAARKRPKLPTPLPEAISDQGSKSIWNVIIGLAVGLGVLLFSVAGAPGAGPGPTSSTR